MDRIDDFTQMIQANPTSPMPRYALGMELKNRGKLEEAVKAFQELITVAPDFPSAYQQGGMVLVTLNRTQEAKDMYRAGIQAAIKKGDRHTQNELESFLDELE